MITLEVEGVDLSAVSTAACHALLDSRDGVCDDVFPGDLSSRTT